ncbi:hypothetical protein [Alkalihalobacterium bogoriense]|uniref:hypothetical protein n=1 Tax=Alkalihalobacterium bogoriense TaxID=246272 RepID=UPI0004793483|nr:hypothetical protein [Alkalihalobacterium bogoriense]
MNQEVRVQTKPFLYVIGLFIFGGMALTSMIDASFYIEKYSVEKLWHYRIFIMCSAVVYYSLVILYYRKRGE